MLKLKHFAGFIFEDRDSFDHNPTVNNDFEAQIFRGSMVIVENRKMLYLENTPLYGMLDQRPLLYTRRTQIVAFLQPIFSVIEAALK